MVLRAGEHQTAEAKLPHISDGQDYHHGHHHYIHDHDHYCHHHQHFPHIYDQIIIIEAKLPHISDGLIAYCAHNPHNTKIRLCQEI